MSDSQARWLSAILHGDGTHGPFEKALAEGIGSQHFAGEAGDLFAVLNGLYAERAPFSMPILRSESTRLNSSHRT